METIIKISRDQNELAYDLAGELAGVIGKASRIKRSISVALSGGSTPRLLYSVIGDHFADRISWDFVHLFWGDERCVPPSDPESNYGMTKEILLDRIKIPAGNIHRISGENDPENESVRYSEEIMKNTVARNGLPVFDFIILGLGEDGHTASIFARNKELFKSRKICAVTAHPVSGQKRVTLTGRVINNADNIVFLVSGSTKAAVVAEIIDRPGISEYPAASVEPLHGVVKWYLDNDAASMLNQWA